MGPQQAEEQQSCKTVWGSCSQTQWAIKALKVYQDARKGEKSKHINLNALNSHVSFPMQK